MTAHMPPTKKTVQTYLSEEQVRVLEALVKKLNISNSALLKLGLNALADMHLTAEEKANAIEGGKNNADQYRLG